MFAAVTRPAPLPELEDWLTERRVIAWLVEAPAGAKLTYHSGFLARDRMPGMSELSEESRRRAHAIAFRVMTAAAHGAVRLIQHRHGPEDYAYIAVKAKRRAVGRMP
jgi:hypothetical protein